MKLIFILIANYIIIKTNLVLKQDIESRFFLKKTQVKHVFEKTNVRSQRQSI